MASLGKPAQCLMRRKRSSSAAAMILPSRIRQADASPWNALMPSMFKMNACGYLSIFARQLAIQQLQREQHLSIGTLQSVVQPSPAIQDTAPDEICVGEHQQWRGPYLQPQLVGAP